METVLTEIVQTGLHTYNLPSIVDIMERKT